MEEFKIKKSKHIRKIIITCPLILIGFGALVAQQNSVASGGDAIGTGGVISYSIGQIDYITSKGSLGTITEGLQQPYEILTLSGFEETGISLSVYPNPTTDFVVLSVLNSNTQNMTYTLYDLLGKIIENKKLSGSLTSISMINLANDIYFIKVLNNDIELKVFKIIKNK
ncbi:MAG: T9SS type A sorting domain-containing protein [Bacteroidetes bacterium]|nr:T9SS type A sorting domain-containing protein [Bacteroidota bacterium]